MKHSVFFWMTLASLLSLGLVAVMMRSLQNSSQPPRTETTSEKPLQVSSPLDASSITSPQTSSNTKENGTVPSKIATNNKPSSSFNVVKDTDKDGAPFEYISKNIETILQAAGHANDYEKRKQLWRVLAKELIQEDPAAANDVLERIKLNAYKIELAEAYGRLLLQENPNEAMHWVEGLPNQLVRENTAHTLARELARSDVNLATQWVEANEDSNVLAFAVDGIAYEWARQDVEAAYEWAAVQSEEAFHSKCSSCPTPPDVTIRDQAMTKIAEAMGEDDPQAAAVWAAQFPEGTARTRALRSAIAKWVETDANATAEWVASLPPSLSRDKALLHIASRWAQDDADAALNWALSLPDDDTMRHDVVISIARATTNVSPEKAMQLAETLPAGTTRANVLSETKQKWVRKDPVAAANGFLKLADASERARMVRHTTSLWSKSDPAGAADFVSSLDDPKLRKETMIQVATHWLRKDRDAAASWIKNTSFSEHLKQQLLSQAPKNALN